MKRTWRLLKYTRPYALYVLASLVTTAVFAAMTGLRAMLIKPIIDNVLNANESPRQVLVYTIPRTHHARQSSGRSATTWVRCWRTKLGSA
jgi:subfamily B ATP-binding cassette protein MsbA